MPKIFYKELQKKISSKSLDKIYFLYGEEKGLAVQTEKLLIKSKIGDNHNDFNFMKITGDNPDISNIEIYLNTYPVFCENKCMVIRNLDVENMKNDDISELIETIKDIPEFSMLIINQTTMQTDVFKSPTWKSFISKITPFVSVTEFLYRDNPKLEEQIISHAHINGKIMPKKLAQALIKRCGKNAEVLKMEIDKLCAFEQSDTITEESIEAVIIDLVDYNVFSMCNSLLSRNYSDVFRRLENLFDNNENAILILSAIASNYIDLFRVKAALESGNSYGKVSDYFDYKNKEFKLDIANRHVRKMDMFQIKSCIGELILSDKDLKNSSLPPKVIIYLLVARLIKIQERIK